MWGARRVRRTFCVSTKNPGETDERRRVVLNLSAFCVSRSLCRTNTEFAVPPRGKIVLMICSGVHGMCVKWRIPIACVGILERTCFGFINSTLGFIYTIKGKVSLVFSKQLSPQTTWGQASRRGVIVVQSGCQTSLTDVFDRSMSERVCDQGNVLDSLTLRMQRQSRFCFWEAKRGCPWV